MININKLTHYTTSTRKGIENDPSYWVHIASNEEVKMKVGEIYVLEESDDNKQFIFNGIKIPGFITFSIVTADKYGFEAKVVIVTVNTDEVSTLIESEPFDVAKKIIAIESTSREVRLEIQDIPQVIIVPDDKVSKIYPLWKVKYEQRIVGVKNSDIKTGSFVEYYVRRSPLHTWELYYEERCGDYIFASHRSALTLEQLKEHYGYYEKAREYVMFDHNGRMFTDVHYIDTQKCICGTAIDEYHNDYDDDSSIKVNMVKDIIFGYERDCLSMVGGNIYMNGKRLITKKELEEQHGILYHQACNMYPEWVREKLQELYPSATSYKSFGASGSLNPIKNNCIYDTNNIHHVVTATKPANTTQPNGVLTLNGDSLNTMHTLNDGVVNATLYNTSKLQFKGENKHE